MISALLTRYDTAHGYPNQDILDEDENTIAKIILNSAVEKTRMAIITPLLELAGRYFRVLVG